MGLTMKRKGLRLLAIVLALVMVIGLVPASAAKKKSYTVSTVSEFIAVAIKAGAGTITLESTATGKLKIKDSKLSATEKKRIAKKDVVINAPKAKVTNYLKFNSITIVTAKTYTEAANGNNIELKSDNTSFSVAKKKTVNQLKVNSSKANVTVKSKAKIKELIVNKASANVTLKVLDNADVNVTINKKSAKLTVKGNEKADVDIAVKAAKATVNASVPVEIETSKNMKFNAEMGAAGSVVEKSSDKVKVTVAGLGKAKTTVVTEGQDKTTPTPTVKVTPTPTATPTPTPTQGAVIVNPDGGFSGGASSGDGSYSGGGSSSGGGSYSGSGSSSGGGSSSGSTSTVTTPDPTPIIIDINETNFPDEIFRKFVADKYDIDKDGKFSEEELNKVTLIDCNPSEYRDLGINKEDYEEDWQYSDAIWDKKNALFEAGEGIKSLKGIEFFTALEELVCSYNQLSEIDLSSNTKLIKIYASHNKLTSINISKNELLTNFDASFNQLESIDLSNNTKLKEIILWDNKLKSIDVSKNTLVTYLDCDTNNLSELDITANTALETIYCCESQLTTLDLSKNSALKYFYISGNKISALDFSNNPEIKEIECQNNNLQSIIFANNEKLKELYCGDNVLENIDISECKALNRINCQNNKITQLDITKNIELTYNNIVCDEGVEIIDGFVPVTISEQTFPDINFRNYILDTIDKDGNQILSGQELDINTLNCSELNIKDLTGIEYFTRLTYLNCAENELSTLDLSSNIALTSLVCSYNPFTALDFSKNTALKEMSLYGFGYAFDSLDLTQNTKLTNLHYNDNSLVISRKLELNEENYDDSDYLAFLKTFDTNNDGYLTSEEAQAVKTLDISGYHFDSEATFNIFNNLDTLIMKGVEISYLELRGFKIKNLDLSDAKINHLDCSNVGLESINLSGSTITYLYCGNNNLESLDLGTMSELMFLYCYNNRLSSLNTAGLIQLNTLNCENNYITELNLSDNQNLSSFRCDPNVVVTRNIIIDESSFEDNIFRDYVKQFDTNNDGILSNNELNAVTAIDVSGKAITSLKGITVFANLENLNCRGTEITTLNLVGPKKVKSIDASENAKLESLYCHESNLQTLNVSGSAIRFLEIENNAIENLDVSTLSSLESLYCWDNPLGALDLSKNPELNYLDCDYCELNVLDVSNNPKLTHINCCGNNFTEIDISQNPLLKVSDVYTDSNVTIIKNES